MLRSRSICSIHLLILAAVAGPAALAQQAAADSGVSALQEVVVTAQKREEKLHDVPMGISAVVADDINTQQLVDFADLQSKVPGLSVQLSAPGLERLSIRGENVGSVGSTVTTYIDETPFGSSNALANGSVLAGDFDTWDLQRVEVLRGPQGTLYGAGSEGGLLKYVTNAPDPTKFAAALQLGDEEVSNGENAGSVKGMVNVPLADRAAFRVSGFYSTIPGFIDDPNLNEKDINHGYRAGLRASFLLHATDNFSVRLSAFGQTLHTDGTPYADVVGNAGTPQTPPADQLQLTHGELQQDRFIDEPADFKYRIYSAQLNWNLGWGALTSITSYGTTEEDQFTDATAFPVVQGLSFGDLASSLTGVSTGVNETNDLNVKKFTEEVRLASATGQTLEWQVGAFYTRESSTLDQNLPTFLIPSQADAGLPAPLEVVSLNALYREWSGFGEFTYHFNPQFDLALGARWSENKQSADQSIGGLLVNPTQLSSGASSESDFTYSVAPRWHISDNTMVYARIASGYRPGGPNALPASAPPSVPHEYEADRTVNYEVGTRTSLADNRVSIDVDAFLIDWSKIQLVQIINNFGINANGGKARSQGLEWTLGLTPADGLKFALTGAYVDAYLTENAPAAGASDGDRLPYAPKWSGSLDGSYTRPTFRDFNVFAGATWSYIGSRTSDFSATTEVVGGAIVAIPNPRAELPSYDTVNLRLGLDNPHWMFLLYCKNLTDKRGITVYNNTGTGGFNGFGGSIGVIQPRTIGATITAKF